METTEDGLLDRRVLLRQPRRGYRAGSDAVLLAAAVPAKPGQAALDAGAGVGAAALCLASRCPGVFVQGLEIQPDLVGLAAANIDRNGHGGMVEVKCGDIRRPPPEIGRTLFDHTLCNPPFYVAGRASTSPNSGKAAAHGEGDTPLEDWLAFCLRRTVPGGTVSIIHRAERLDALLAGLSRGGGDIKVYPLWPKPGRVAKRVIVQARVQGKGPTMLLPGLCLHHDDGADTGAARSILRDGGGLDLASPP